MNYGELKKQIIDLSHRTDLEDEVPLFIQRCGERLGRRFGFMPTPLVADTDTNSILTTHSSLYLYGSLREVHVYTNYADGITAFETLFQLEVENMNINYKGLDWVACSPPVMKRIC